VGNKSEQGYKKTIKTLTKVVGRMPIDNSNNNGKIKFCEISAICGKQIRAKI
jgi:hypothetical protein